MMTHPKLFARLHSAVRGTMLLWLQSFLCVRTHGTRIDGVFSDVAQLISGIVPVSGTGQHVSGVYQRASLYS